MALVGTQFLNNAAVAVAAGAGKVAVWSDLTSSLQRVKSIHVAWGAFGTSGSVDIYGSLDKVNWVKLGSLVAATPFLVVDGVWPYLTHALSGTLTGTDINSAACA